MLQFQHENVDVQISTETIRRQLKEAHLQLRISARGAALTVKHRRVGFTFTGEQVNWTEQILSTIVARTLSVVYTTDIFVFIGDLIKHLRSVIL